MQLRRSRKRLRNLSMRSPPTPMMTRTSNPSEKWNHQARWRGEDEGADEDKDEDAGHPKGPRSSAEREKRSRVEREREREREKERERHGRQTETGRDWQADGT